MIKLLLRRLLAFLPTKLPVGITEFDAFANDIIELSGRYADDLSMRFAIASMVIHAPSHKGALSKHYFVVRLRKSAANQVASQVFQDVKIKQDEARQASQPTQDAVTPAETPPSAQG